MAKGKQMLYTQQGYQELVDELHYLKHEKREKIKNDIAVARSFGDLSENSEYDEARNEQAKNEARIKELEELVENAVILDESNIDTSVVSLGSTVKVAGPIGEVVYDFPTVAELQRKCTLSLNEFWSEYKRLDKPQIYKVDLSDKLYNLKQELLAKGGKR